MVNAIACEVTRVNIARRSIVRIQRAPDTAFAPRVPVFVRKDGKEWIVVKWIKKLYSVSQIAVGMGISIWKLKLVCASPCGPVTIVPKVRVCFCYPRLLTKQ